jgi:hypothetical protein
MAYPFNGDPVFSELDSDLEQLSGRRRPHEDRQIE